MELPSVHALPSSRRELRETVAGVVEGFRRHRLPVYASAMAYQLLGALIPLTCFALALASMLRLESLWTDHIAPQVESRVSGAVFTVLDDTVTQVLAQRHLFWLTIGLVLTVYELSGAMRATMRALDAMYEAKEDRSGLAFVVRSVWLGAVFGALVLGALAALGFLPGLLGVPVAALAMFVAVALTVRYGPANPQPPGWVSFGSAVVVLSWLVCASAYGLYVTQIADPSSAFGPLAAIFVLLVFVYVSTIAFLVGALIDANVREESTGNTSGQ